MGHAKNIVVLQGSYDDIAFQLGGPAAATAFCDARDTLEEVLYQKSLDLPRSQFFSMDTSFSMLTRRWASAKDLSYAQGNIAGNVFIGILKPFFLGEYDENHSQSLFLNGQKHRNTYLDWSKAFQARPLHFAYFNDKKEACGVSIQTFPEIPELWIATVITNTTAMPEKRTVTLLGNIEFMQAWNIRRQIDCRLLMVDFRPSPANIDKLCPFAYGAYIVYGEEVYYVNSVQGTLDAINLLPDGSYDQAISAFFHKLYPLKKGEMSLTPLEQKKITQCTGHKHMPIEAPLPAFAPCSTPKKTLLKALGSTHMAHLLHDVLGNNGIANHEAIAKIQARLQYKENIDGRDAKMETLTRILQKLPKGPYPEQQKLRRKVQGMRNLARKDIDYFANLDLAFLEEIEGLVDADAAAYRIFSLLKPYKSQTDYLEYIALLQKTQESKYHASVLQKPYLQNTEKDLIRTLAGLLLEDPGNYLYKELCKPRNRDIKISLQTHLQKSYNTYYKTMLSYHSDGFLSLCAEKLMDTLPFRHTENQKMLIEKAIAYIKSNNFVPKSWLRKIELGFKNDPTTLKKIHCHIERAHATLILWKAGENPKHQHSDPLLTYKCKIHALKEASKTRIGRENLTPLEIIGKSKNSIGRRIIRAFFTLLACCAIFPIGGVILLLKDTRLRTGTFFDDNQGKEIRQRFLLAEEKVQQSTQRVNELIRSKPM